jgi:UDP-N-acetylmuramyl-tripeptide synthetase
MALTQLHTLDQALAWLRQRAGAGVRAMLRTDSRRVGNGDVFIAWPGAATDGRRHVVAALQAGACACMVEADGVAAFDLGDPRIAAYPSLKAAAGPLASSWFGHPSRQLQVLAVTGTNGKTSTAWWSAQALSALGKRCAVVGTLGIGEPTRPGAVQDSALMATGLTTPDPFTLNAALRQMVDDGFSACAIEASSIGLQEHRLDGLHIAVALFTNFTQDHLDYHGSMAAYWAAKRVLFNWPGLRAAVLNIDDPKGAELARELSGGSLDLWTVSLQQQARMAGLGLRTTAAGLALDVHEGATGRMPLVSALVGDYNASNLLCVLAGLRALGIPLANAVGAVAALTPVPGRLQRLSAAGIEVVVDYAHTPDALQKVLHALRPLAAARQGRLWCVFGCGGNRDAGKRPLMGAIAMQGADHVVITSDNPRHEDPALIAAQIEAGARQAAIGDGSPLITVLERAQAIVHAVLHAAPGDVVLLAGKGHEDTQDVAGVKRPFLDAAQAQAALAQRVSGHSAAASTGRANMSDRAGADAC